LSMPILLAAGKATTISIVVTAQDGTTKKTYTITVNRAPSANANLIAIGPGAGPLTPGFSSATTGYAINVPNATATMTVQPFSADPNATITVNGSALTPGNVSEPVALTEGGATIISITVTAQDGSTKKTYTLTVNRAASSDARLIAIGPSIKPVTPGFNSAITGYTINVPNGTSSMTVKPVANNAGATITVNTITVASGSASDAIPLTAGAATTITIIVTAQDGSTTKTYMVTVNRAPGGADGYEPISVSSPTETPALAEDGIVVHQGISPNGDGLNDFLQIDNISQYPDNKLAIMNRNGQLIYEAKGYDNSSKAFDGHSNKNGQMQLPGTYFYQLDYTVKGIVKHKTGFIVLKY